MIAVAIVGSSFIMYIFSQKSERVIKRILRGGIWPPDPGGFVVCHSHKFMFVAISKNASTSLKYAILELENITPTSKGVHNYFGQVFDKENFISVKYSQEDKYKNFTKFAVYRDPVDRFISFYKNKILQENSKIRNSHTVGYLQKNGLINADIDSIIAFIEKELMKKPQLQDQHIRPQCLYYSPSAVDYIVPIEKLSQFTREKLGFNFEIRKNLSSKGNMKPIQEQVNKIRILYENDYKIRCNY